MADEFEVGFMRDAAPDGDAVNLADDPKMKLLATCIISQQAAGFRDKKDNPIADLRQSKCPDCGAPGFNTGWGYWMHACGAEILSDGEPSEPCRSRAALEDKR